MKSPELSKTDGVVASKGIIDSIYSLAFSYFRGARFELAKERLGLQKVKTLLDVGGYPSFWLDKALESRIYCLNMDLAEEPVSIDNCTVLLGNGCQLPFADQSVDVCFSNSVIEHVGGWQEQQNFAREVRRVGKNYWVQTPNRWFFFETHILAPFWHWLPASKVQRFMVRYFSIWGLVNRPSWEGVQKFLDHIRLLDARQLETLFPDGEILEEKVLFFTKSFIVVRRRED